MLLQRATQDAPPAVPVGMADFVDELGNLPDKPIQPAAFDPLVVSEALWSEWCNVVERFGIGSETLGRLAPSLKKLPTVIWNTPIGDYLGHTVSEIRKLRTHGEKRVRCVLEVFHFVHQQLSGAQLSDDIKQLLAPPSIAAIRAWCDRCLDKSITPTEEDIREQFAKPFLDQILIDSGSTVHKLAEERLGINGDPVSVRIQARNLGVTRARIYQLLDDCAKVMSVRWPDGKRTLDMLTSNFAVYGPDSQNLGLFFGLRELCYPEKNKVAETTSEGPSQPDQTESNDPAAEPNELQHV